MAAPAAAAAESQLDVEHESGVGSPNGSEKHLDGSTNATGGGWVARWNKLIWHGGSVYDAWFNAVSAQVGQVILSMPYSFSQMGFGFGVMFQLLYLIIGCWTCYLLACLYLEYRNRREKQGVKFTEHVIQYHEVMGALVGRWAQRITMFFNIMAMGSVAVVQIIACASNAYYLDSGLDKREWTFVFGGIAMFTALLPTIHNFRVWSIMGVITTTYTAWYMMIASLVHGQEPNVRHSAPKEPRLFFTGATNMLFAYRGHAITVEIMHAMWKPQRYKYVYLVNCIFVLTITLPHSVSVYWAYGDELLHNSNAFAVMPHSVFRSIGLVFMIIHQAVAFGLYVMPLYFMWEKLMGMHEKAHYIKRILVRLPVSALLFFLALLVPFFGPLNSVIGSMFLSVPTFILPPLAYLITFRTKQARAEAVDKPYKWIPWRGIVVVNIAIVVVISVVGVGFGCWASISNIIDQFHTFGFFEKCYQCSSTH